jgi:co-chaperonin GroES (HSP10)
MKRLIPLLDQVLVEQHKAQKTVGSLGLTTVQSDQRKPNRGTVIRAAKSTGFSSGDEIIFDQFANPMNIEENGVSYILISASKIFGVME